MKRPPKWKIKMAMDFKDGKSMAHIAEYYGGTPQLNVENAIRDVLIWQGDEVGKN